MPKTGVSNSVYYSLNPAKIEAPLVLQVMQIVPQAIPQAILQAMQIVPQAILQSMQIVLQAMLQVGVVRYYTHQFASHAAMIAAVWGRLQPAAGFSPPPSPACAPTFFGAALL